MLYCVYTLLVGVHTILLCINVSYCMYCASSGILQVSEEVFKHVFIPRTLDEVVTYERDADMVAKGQGEDLAYQTVTGMKADLTGPSHTPKLLHHSQEDNTSKEPVIMTSQQEDHCIEQEVVLGQEVDDEKTGSRTDDTNSNISSNSEDDEIDNSEESESDNGETGDREVRRAEERKAHKKTVKEANRERRKNKIPKHVKKRKEKIG